MLALASSLLVLSTLSVAKPIVIVENLFPRASADSPAIGSAEWQAQYPAGGSTPQNVPQEWLDALKAAEDAGLIPGPSVVPIPNIDANGWPTYPGFDPLSDAICSNDWGCVAPDDVFNAPDGMIGISQDDGPLAPGKRLYEFFAQETINATHFYIGANCVANSDIMLQAMALPGQHFAVHTWSHPHMAGLSNVDIVSELGWSMKVLADINHGKIPSWWRPPFGNVDNRVRAIASSVFGLKTVIWNQDSEDWKIGAGSNEDAVKTSISGWINGPKSPGLIMLEHELNDGAVDAFITLWPTFQSQGWDCRTIPDLWGADWYKNAKDGTTDAAQGMTLTSSSNGTSSSNSSSASSSASSASSTAIASSSMVSSMASSSASVSRSASSALVSASASASKVKAAAASASASVKESGAEGYNTLSTLGALIGSLGLLAAIL